MNISTARRALITLVTTLGVAPLLAAAPAFAQSLSYTDTTQDFWQDSFDGSTMRDTYTAVPDQVDGDISRVTARYAGQLVIRLKYADLSREKGVTMFGGYVRTNEGVRRSIDVTIRPSNWAGTMHLTDRHDNKVTCKGATHRVDYTANTMLVTIPASCLSQPRWVQLQLASALIRGKQANLYVDDAQSPGHGFRTWSPRIHRG